MTAPESVPEVRDEWRDTAWEAYADALSRNTSLYAMTAALAAVVPLVQADVGERIAAAIEGDIKGGVLRNGGTITGMQMAARIARAVATGDCTCGPGDACSDPNCGGTPR